MRTLVLLVILSALGTSLMAKDIRDAIKPDPLADKVIMEGGEWWDSSSSGAYTVENYDWRVKAYLAVKSLGDPKVLDSAQLVHAVTSSELEASMTGDWHELEAWGAVSAIGISNSMGAYEFYPVSCEVAGCSVVWPGNGELPNPQGIEEGFSWTSIPKDAVILGAGESFDAIGAKEVMILPVE